MANTVKLPSEGRDGETPLWPLSTSEPPTWAELWTTPQAVAWERLGWTRVVARYAEVVRMCENPEAMSVGFLAEARQLEDRLGLTPMAMLRLRWEVASDEVAEQRVTKAPKTTARGRLKVADNAVAGS
ncbi:hypothetical protein [Nocardioides kribbensis]|uniref:phage terminase small subunit n=1 Tax=Nocardioides kribbensis TaxID=305517 RepID=UPI001879E9A2|nr:hypothetical protein [Nocardioides kribbensis]